MLAGITMHIAALTTEEAGLDRLLTVLRIVRGDGMVDIMEIGQVITVREETTTTIVQDPMLPLTGQGRAEAIPGRAVVTPDLAVTIIYIATANTWFRRGIMFSDQ